ncbi:hypothetical protein NDU88_001399 [Pleurodeles waltl]|uniref:Uncharacterized protein n=1 Tax=Pleurodeles waltl TaxID=8319 RepID=A0AAV7MPT3_PLEWA|nr:hypothetical protein NDU88_001399 [Pleurodeles waltl]
MRRGADTRNPLASEKDWDGSPWERSGCPEAGVLPDGPREERRLSSPGNVSGVEEPGVALAGANPLRSRISTDSRRPRRKVQWRGVSWHLVGGGWHV